MRIICKHNTDGCSICEGELTITLEALDEIGQVRDALKALDPREGTVVYETLRQLARILSKEGE